MGKERVKMNQRWKGKWIWNSERKEKIWIKGGKENEYESEKGKGKNGSKVERRINKKVVKERERMNLSWKGE